MKSRSTHLQCQNLSLGVKHTQGRKRTNKHTYMQSIDTCMHASEGRHLQSTWGAARHNQRALLPQFCWPPSAPAPQELAGWHSLQHKQHASIQCWVNREVGRCGGHKRAKASARECTYTPAVAPVTCNLKSEFLCDVSLGEEGGERGWDKCKIGG